VSCYRDRTQLYETLAKQKSLGSSDLGKLVELLRIICVDTLEAFQSYLSANASIFGKHSLETSEIEKSMKMLTLCTLGAKQKKLPYSQIASALQVDQEEVEMWVVDSIANKLMEASMDQFKAEVQVTKVANRSFDPDQWKMLQSRLADLKRNMNAVVNTVRKSTA